MIGTLLILTGYGLWYILNHGALKVISDSRTAEITITPTNETDLIKASGNKGSLTAILRNGTYIVTVKDGQKQQKTFVSVSAFSIKEVTLSPPKLLGTEPVTNLSGPTFAASKNNLSLIDTDSAKVVSVDQNNEYRFSDDTYQFESGVWTSAMNGYAVALKTVDRQKAFLQITNGTVREIALPEAFTNQTYMAFNTNPSGELYVIQNGKVYIRSSAGVYTKIIETNKQALIRSVSSKYISLLYRNAEEECEYQFVSLQQKTIKKMPVTCVQNPDYGYSAAWSADEKYLALTTGSYLAVYDQNFDEQYKIPDPKAAHPVWLSADELAYISGNNVWKYNVDSKTSSVISTTPLYVSIQTMKKADDSDTIYFVGRADDQLSLYRTAAASDTITPIQKLAESNMYELKYFCRIRYINFVSPKLIASTSLDQQSECTKIIEDYLSSITVPTIPIQYILNEEFGYLD